MNWYAFFDLLKDSVFSESELDIFMSYPGVQDNLEEIIDLTLVDDYCNLSDDDIFKIKENIKNINFRIDNGFKPIHKRKVDIHKMFEYEGMSKVKVDPITNTKLSGSIY